MKKTLSFIALTLFLCTAASVQAIQVDWVDGDWVDATPVGKVTISNSGPQGGLSSAHWGVPSDYKRYGRSGYEFYSRTTPFDAPEDGTLFGIGTFVHQNWPIYGSSLKNIFLDLALGGIVNVNTTVELSHNETPNSPGWVDDIVTLTIPVVSHGFSYMGQNYFFSLIGFSQDGGSTITTSFSTKELMANKAELYGKITTEPIPEPTTMLLFGAGLAGLASVMRRKNS